MGAYLFVTLRAVPALQRFFPVVASNDCDATMFFSEVL
jgi:hypothetical protein